MSFLQRLPLRFVDRCGVSGHDGVLPKLSCFILNDLKFSFFVPPSCIFIMRPAGLCNFYDGTAIKFDKNNSCNRIVVKDFTLITIYIFILLNISAVTAVAKQHYPHSTFEQEYLTDRKFVIRKLTPLLSHDLHAAVGQLSQCLSIDLIRRVSGTAKTDRTV